MIYLLPTVRITALLFSVAASLSLVVSSRRSSSVATDPSTPAHLLHCCIRCRGAYDFPFAQASHLFVGNKVVVGNGRARDGLVSETDCIKGMRPLSHPANSPTQSNPLENKFEGKDALSYANILRSRNKFGDALILYNIVLEKESDNLEALVRKGICLQAQNLNWQTFESFMEVIKLDPQNACALTHYGVLYKDEVRFLETAEIWLQSIFVAHDSRIVEFYNFVYD